MIGERYPYFPERAFRSLAGLRFDWGRSREAGGAVGQPLWRERATADDFVRSRTGVGQCRGFGRWRDNPGDELAECAVVVLVYSRALGRPVRFGVRSYGCRRDTPSGGCIDDADNAWQECLDEGADENPTANRSRKSCSRWCHVT
jgi:hypothetical protein